MSRRSLRIQIQEKNSAIVDRAEPPAVRKRSRGKQDDDDDAVVPQADYTQWFPTLSASRVPLSADIVSADGASSTNYAYPKYEACTPAARSIRHDGEGDVLRFIPYADEGKMARERRLRRFARPYKSFAWQTDWFDVDCE